MKKPVLWAVGALAAAAAGVAVYLAVSDTPASDIIGLAAGGGHRELNEPMRPAGTGPRVIIFALDGVGHDELVGAVREGRARRMAALLGAPAGEGVYAHGWAVPDVLSVLPSTTVAAWSSLFTGRPPAATGVPGNEWFERESMRFVAPAPVSVDGHTDAVAVYADDLVGATLAVPTLYERAGVRSYVALSQVHRGADLLIVPDLGALGSLVTAVAGGVAGGDEMEREKFSVLDEEAVDNTVAALQEHGVPDLLVVYFPGVDLYTHVAEGPVPSQRSYVGEVLDAGVGRILDVYAAAGMLDDTWVLFVSDHGHTPVLEDDRHALGTDGPGEPPAVLQAAGFRVRPFELEPDDDAQDYQAVLAYQGAMAYVYLADRSTCVAAGTVCDWRRAPRMDDDVLAVVRAFAETNRSGASAPGMMNTLDLILAREPRPPGTDALPFQVWDGDRLVPVADYLRQHPRPDLLDLERRLHDLSAGPFGHRAGDVLLLARSGSDRPIEDRFYFSTEYRSWHGSPSQQDSRIPLVVTRRSMAGAAIRETVRTAVGDGPSQIDIVNLVLRLLRPDGLDEEGP
ncbi:MAG TPA: alkaline phosphatase family protein [Longimicrobiales bacterium]|nr:alkaline phosphatase family protein [Longimicrobiales bacterium]